MRAVALGYVVRALQLHDAKHGRVNESPPNIERVVSAVEMLAERQDVELSAFVSVWEEFLAGLEQIDPDSTDWPALLPGATPEQIANLVGQERAGRSERRFLDLHIALLGALVDELRCPDESRLAYLHPLLELGRSTAVTVATLNYDLTIETAASQIGVTCSNGLERWTDDWALGWPSTGVHLLKLHGSIDWDREVRWSPAEDRALNLPQTVPGLTEAATVGEGSDPEFLPFVVFGSREKLRPQGPFLDLRAHLIATLRRCSHLVVIGYGSGDDHINEVILRWINTRADRKLIVVDPNFPSSWPSATGFNWHLLTSLQRQVGVEVGAISESRLGILRTTAAAAMPIVTAGTAALDAIVAEAIST